MFRIETLGAFGYGGVVTLTEWWDNKRISKGTLTKKQFLKKASFYSYLGLGLVATLCSIFGWMRRWDNWFTPISHGFFYDMPRFGYNMFQSLSAAGSSQSRAVSEAQRILHERQSVNQIAQGQGQSANRTYQPEMKRARIL